MLTVLGIALGILVVLAITALTGYFVAQEFAYMAVDRSRLKARAEAGDTAAARALSVTRRTSFMLSGAQLGITVTGLLVGYVAEPLIGSGLGELLGGVGIPTAVGVAVGTVLAVLFSTVVQMVFGELFPKNLAIARPEPVARWLALSTTLYLRLFGWLIKLFDASSNLLLRALRIEPVHDVEHSATVRDLEHIVAESREAGELPKELSTLLDRILDFPTRTAEHAMIPRARVDYVRAGEPITQVLAKMSAGHTRYPVVGASADDLRGVVHLHDLLARDTAAGTAGTVCRPAVIVPTTLPLPDVLARLTEGHEEMALVVDEYGGFAGVVTVEDMAEELVGEIADEHDTAVETQVITRQGEGWVIRGDVHLDEVARTLGHELPEGDYETLAGLVIAEFGGLPTVGDTVAIPLEPDPAELAHVNSPPTRTLIAEVRGIDRHVPASVLVTVRTDHEVSDDE
ncbi:membrane protein [Rhodococcus ruber Chol-4]|uniref:Putative membrane protein n=1 Tax=Rhodococcus ruber TaxID=1830 RepID=A0A098BMF1_9NOCA|nr:MULTISPECIES: hemolysin family protein [Rhodococcus]RIK05439.1 MAG: HlyC/CorC family transporter [Acidobacteriota bacterium]AUM19091.1 HlyC/CorC family transporter [Rhodococcus ruber]AWH01465.1 HlyC/CorC family transporter [Rhodococcus ruber]KXF85692.1 membrane protein [Rhodococcus ruber Chol-4]MBD8055093.1 HlyC/CorC family transporter [Rhodococcus ruber]